MSLQNLWFGMLSMEEKGKVVTIKIDDKQEELQALFDEIEEVEDVEEDIQSAQSTTKFPKYVPL